MHFSYSNDIYIQKTVKAAALAAAKHQSPVARVARDHLTLEVLTGGYPQHHPTRTQIHEYHNKFLFLLPYSGHSAQSPAHQLTNWVRVISSNPAKLTFCLLCIFLQQCRADAMGGQDLAPHMHSFKDYHSAEAIVRKKKC